MELVFRINTSIDYSLYIDPSAGNTICFMNGQEKAVMTGRNPAVGDLFKMKLTPTAITFEFSTNNGTTWQNLSPTATGPISFIAPAYPLLIDSCFYDEGAAVDNITYKIL